MNGYSLENIKNYNFIKEIKKLPFVEKVILFGSRARGDNSLRSDIDIAIICSKATDEDWLKIMKIVDDADTLLEIDCLNLATADEGFKKRILKDGVEL